MAAEVEWLQSLMEAGVPVAEPLATTDGRWVVELSEPAQVLVAFRRAPGVMVQPDEWTEARLESWGALLGRLQAHGRAFRPEGEPRRTLLERSNLHLAAEALPDDPAFLRAVGELRGAAENLLDHGQDSGLVHADLHSGNVLLHEERWTAIDFDDSGYGAYAFDLAMPLYYAIQAQPGRNAADAAASFLPPFLRGFRRHAPDPGGGTEAVAQALTLRDAELVIALHLKLPPEAWTDGLHALEKALRSRVTAGRWVLGPATLRRWFG